MEPLGELPPFRRVAWAEREWFWWVVRYQHRPGAVVMTLKAFFMLPQTARNVAAAMCGAHFDGADSVPKASAEERVRHAIEARDFSNVTAAELREHGGKAMTSRPDRAVLVDEVEAFPDTGTHDAVQLSRPCLSRARKAFRSDLGWLE